jgi:SagB-type dehydrogenase family enzyme
LGILLAVLRRTEMPLAPVAKRRYPSAGGLYPVQAYLWFEPGAVMGVPAGPYHYDPAAHRLMPLAAAGASPAGLSPEVHLPVNRAVAEIAAFTLLFVADLGVIAPLYGDTARDFSLIEAGAMLQLLMEVAPRHGIGLCPVSHLAPSALIEPLGLDPSQEVLHALLGGRIEPAQRSAGGWLHELAASAGRPLPPERALAEELQRQLEVAFPDLAATVRLSVAAAFPRTADGRIDRQALVEGEPASSTLGKSARTASERVVEEVWREVLGEVRLRLDDNFFDLGATSFHLVQVGRRLQERLQMHFPLLDLLQAPSLRSLARLIDRQRPASASVEPAWARAAARQSLRRERASREGLRR